MRTQPAPAAKGCGPAPAASSDAARVDLMEELFRLYGQGLWRRRLVYWRKKYAWCVLVGGARVLKRSIDLLAASLCLLLGAPLMLLIALCIKLTDGGPVFYVSTRVGKWGREFRFPKFRSMVVDAERRKQALIGSNDHGDSVTFKMRDDPRITWIGRLLRKSSLDEMPQLWCVLTGEMSLVGPRPPVPDEVAKYTLTDRRRLDVTPGLTCIWQVSGRGRVPFAEQVRLDTQYIESRSLWLDLKLLLRTIPAVLKGEGAY